MFGNNEKMCFVANCALEIMLARFDFGPDSSVPRGVAALDHARNFAGFARLSGNP